ncbi:MAG TPA: pseudaminic acid synthase [Cellvibrionaceae bacterium]
MNAPIYLGSRRVGQGFKPFIIAEMSGNHNQSLERALAIVDAAAAAGVDALKIQTYTPDTMTIASNRDEFLVQDPGKLWAGKSLYQLYQEAYTPWPWHAEIFARCRHWGIEGFSTPFDESAVTFLEELNIPFYKIASFENTDLPLLATIAKTGKPVIMSTGMARINELNDAVQCLRDNGCTQLILLKCTSTYPTSPENTHINTIPHMAKLFNCPVGLSDHTMGVGVAVASIALGACVVEKHFTLARADGGVDSAFSLEPAELQQLVVESERAFLALGQVNYGQGEHEDKMRRYRRSIYVTHEVKKGELFSEANTKIIRPSLGLAPKYYHEILGKAARCDIPAEEPLCWAHIE